MNFLLKILPRRRSIIYIFYHISHGLRHKMICNLETNNSLSSVLLFRLCLWTVVDTVLDAWDASEYLSPFASGEASKNQK